MDILFTEFFVNYVTEEPPPPSSLPNMQLERALYCDFSSDHIYAISRLVSHVLSHAQGFY